MITYSLRRVDRYMYSRCGVSSPKMETFSHPLLSRCDQSRYTCDYTLKIANWAHLRHADCRKLQRTADLNRIVARLENVIYLHPLFLPSLPNLLENDIYVTVRTAKSHGEQKTAEEMFSTNYRQGRLVVEMLAS